jgi:uncharacterized tellurite resistance protein B-like protein
MFFQKDNNNLVKVAALLIHAAKIDEDYSYKEEDIIKELLLKIGAENENIDDLIKESKKIEEDSNQILNFTKEIKNMNQENKIKIIESLWKIIYSDKNADIYETGLMRRLAGLLYIDTKIMGDIKEKIKKENL